MISVNTTLPPSLHSVKKEKGKMKTTYAFIDDIYY